MTITTASGRDRTAELVARAHRGDRAACDQLFEAVAPRLLLYIRLRYRHPGDLGAREDAEDILQRAYIEAIGALATFQYRGPGSFYRWMREIARLAIARTFDVHHKAQCRDAKREVRVAAMPADQAEALRPHDKSGPTSPSRSLERREKIEALARALEALPNHYREVVTCHKLEELSFAETAARVGRSEAACKMIYFRAMTALRDLLAGDPTMTGAIEGGAP